MEIANKSTMERLTPEILLNITQYVDIKTILALSLTCKAFSSLVSDERILKRLVDRDYNIRYKHPDITWQQLYNQLQHHQISLCTHLSDIPNNLSTSKQELIKNYTDTKPLCSSCQNNTSIYLSLNNSSDKQVCRSCSAKEEGPSSVQYNLEATNLYCFKCSRQVGGKSSNDNEKYKVKIILKSLGVEANINTNTENVKSILQQHLNNEPIQPTSPYASTPESTSINTTTTSTITTETAPATTTTPTEILPDTETQDNNIENQEDIEKRRKAEQLLYIQELRQEDMSLKHYLVEKSWGRAWMMFRTREGSPSPGPITNNKLARSNGTLDPNIRIPMDKFRPAPETHADIVSEKLWKYLEKTYGVQGKAYSEDDMEGPEYARLRICVDDFKHSIQLYP
ncbi:hypothetical protein BJ944DRAFT_260155 [Cunninghamella echinulata]|nr:hypothetical protein BJ944DRAFT_260155 [Cunninghamella echinulata]